MALSHDLLEQATHLAKREPRRPRQASLRRAISAAYYALFRLLIDDASERLVPSQPQSLRFQVRRAFVHREMYEVCRQFNAGAPHPTTTRLIDGSVEPELRRVARAFVQLQDARHEADYDVSVALDRVAALQLLAVAEDAFRAWQQVRRHPNATAFLAALLLQARWR